MRHDRIRRLIRRYAVRLPRRLVNEVRDRTALCARVLAYGTPLKSKPPPPEPGTRVLEVSVGGVFHVRIPDGMDEDDDRWDEWVDAALTAAQEDGRWFDCTAIEDMQAGVLGTRGYVLSPSEQHGGTD
ncbi:MAG: hypothetical protein EPO65_07390, partial [Dehalococcoidia bacterium]